MDHHDHHQEKFFAFPPNARQICYYICPTKCPVICLPRIPSILNISPPPPPHHHPPPPPPPLIEKQSNQNIFTVVIIIVAILASAFFLIIYYAILAKCLSNRNSSESPTTPPTDIHEENDLTQNPMDLIWYVRTVGLEESVINSISVCKYKRGESLVEETVCSVCLNEFHDDDNLRLLPKCSHAFHLPCIDTWLKSHVNCPLCRAIVVSNPASSPLTAPSSISSDAVDESQMGSSQAHIELGSNQSNVEVGSQRLAQENASELGDLFSPRLNYKLRALSDLIDNRRTRGRAIEMIDDKIQQEWRSISMDSLSTAMIGISLANLPTIDSGGSSTASGVHSTRSKKSYFHELSSPMIISPKHGWNQSIYKSRNGTKGSSLQKGHVLMKRSFPGGSKFPFSRYGRSQNSILPL